MEIVEQYPCIISFICAELFFCITRSLQITVILKKETQRTEAENREVQNGLRRSLLLEAFLFVPVSVGLFLLTIFPLIADRFPQVTDKSSLWYTYYGLVGVAAYGFPFSAIRKIVREVALVTIRRFAEITAEKPAENDSQTESNSQK